MIVWFCLSVLDLQNFSPRRLLMAYVLFPKFIQLYLITIYCKSFMTSINPSIFFYFCKRYKSNRSKGETQTSLFPLTFSNSLWEILRRSLQWVLGLHRGLFPVDASKNLQKVAFKSDAGTTSADSPFDSEEKGLFFRFPLLKLLPLSLRLSPDTLWRKLISATWICDIILSVTTQISWPWVRVGKKDEQRKHWFLARLPLCHNKLMQHPYFCWWSYNLSIFLFLYPTISREQDPQMLKLILLRERPTPDLVVALHLFPVENHGLRLRERLSYSAVNAWGHVLKEPTELHLPQKAEMQPWGSQTRHPPFSNNASRSCSWTPQAGSVTRGSPGGISFYKMGTTNATVPDLTVILKECVSQDNSTTSRAFSISGKILSIPDTL